MWIRFRLLVIPVSALLLAGCGVTFYTESRDKAGQEAKAEWAKVNLSDQTSIPRNNHDAVLAQQQALETQAALTRQRNTAQAFVLEPDPAPDVDPKANTLQKRLRDPIDKELNAVIGGIEPANILSNNSGEVYKSDLRRRALTASAIGLELPTCADVKDRNKVAAFKAAAKPLGDRVDAYVDDLAKVCDQLASEESKLPANGEYGEARNDLKTALSQLVEGKADAQNKRNALTAQVKAYDDFVDAHKLEPDKVKAELERRTDELKKAAEAVKAVDDALSVHLLSDESAKSIDKYLAAMAAAKAGKGAPPDSSRLTMVFVLLPDIESQVRTGLNDAEKANLVPLLMAKSLAQARSDGAERDVASRVAIINLLEERVAALARRATVLSTAAIALENPRSPQLDFTMPMSRALQPAHAVGSVADQRPFDGPARVWRAAAYYLYDLGSLRPRIRQIDNQLKALDDERVLSAAETNVALWNTLITSTVNQAADFATTGIKSSDILALFNAAALIWIERECTDVSTRTPAHDTCRGRDGVSWMRNPSGSARPSQSGCQYDGGSADITRGIPANRGGT